MSSTNYSKQKTQHFSSSQSLSDAQPKNINNDNDKLAELLQQLEQNASSCNSQKTFGCFKNLRQIATTKLQQIVAKTSFCNKLLQTINRHLETVRLWLWMLQKMTTTTNFLSFFCNKLKKSRSTNLQ